MEKLHVSPKSNLTETQVIDPMSDGFRKSTRNGNSKVIVMIAGAPYIFERIRAGLAKTHYGYLFNEQGAVVATAHFDESDL